MEIHYNCFACSYSGYEQVRQSSSYLIRFFWKNNYIKCPYCGTINDVWFSSFPPVRHIIKYIINNFLIYVNYIICMQFKVKHIKVSGRNEQEVKQVSNQIISKTSYAYLGPITRKFRFRYLNWEYIAHLYDTNDIKL